MANVTPKHNKVNDGMVRVNKTARLINQTYPVEFDNAFKQSWDQLNEFYNTAGQGIIVTAESINEMIHAPVMQSYLDDPELNKTIKGINEDITTFTTKLTEIHNRHKERTGTADSEEANIAILSFVSEYAEWNTMFQAVTTPSLLVITEFVGNAVNKQRANKEEVPVEAIPETQPE